MRWVDYFYDLYLAFSEHGTVLRIQYLHLIVRDTAVAF